MKILISYLEGLSGLCSGRDKPGFLEETPISASGEIRRVEMNRSA